MIPNIVILIYINMLRVHHIYSICETAASLDDSVVNCLMLFKFKYVVMTLSTYYRENSDVPKFREFIWH